jgi:hypothetical protein
MVWVASMLMVCIMYVTLLSLNTDKGILLIFCGRGASRAQFLRLFQKTTINRQSSRRSLSQFEPSLPSLTWWYMKQRCVEEV